MDHHTRHAMGQVSEWNLTDQVHDDAGGVGIEFQCPDCRTHLTYAQSAWWELECSCPGRTWNLSVRITFKDEGDA